MEAGHIGRLRTLSPYAQPATALLKEEHASKRLGWPKIPCCHVEELKYRIHWPSGVTVGSTSSSGLANDGLGSAFPEALPEDILIAITI